ncbi:MAG: ester cyclase [Flavisolibacter sp.]
MEELTLQKDALARAQQNMLAFFDTHDVKYVAEDAVFKNMNTGETHKGRTEIGALLHYFYHVAFDARAEIRNRIITSDKAVMEALFRGKHIGEIGGVKPTQQEVSVPLVVSYDLKDGLIREARIYMNTDVMMQQLGATAPSAGKKTAFLVRDIFQLKFGHFRDAKKLLEEASEKHMLPEARQMRVLTDFTGDAYRLIFEEGFDRLSDYETSLNSSMKTEDWQQWYEKFKPHVEKSYREILRQIA